MKAEISAHIDELLINSGLFPDVKPSHQNIVNFNFSEETILITGAAGSIGSELSKQLTNCRFKKLILIDIAESPLFDLMNASEFENKHNIHFQILNITQKDSLQHLFSTFQPTIVFHTAAYKHVPLMEANPFESIKVNIFATKLLTDLSLTFEVKKFIFISTDKAVDPISVMGISKRISEDYIAFLSKTSPSIFLTTRFGNVFGSNGSVVPLFKKHIETNRTLTITHKEISRYFINKQKACQLILKIANNDSHTSALFTFNMGKPIKIKHLVERLQIFCKIESVDIRFSKLRDGEKIHEHLVSNNETLLATEDEQIFLVQKNNSTPFNSKIFDRLNKVSAFTPQVKVKEILMSYL
ncbi:polysaccharide biosynthesis protein [Algibacter miyuki]|uniref:Polysaccharide biosynthesis protein n=1 Tax=Algibacter miyuki TaxID=1306933 RepID=A0ABV5GYD1_9FLAO|nr:polysaccharide biosynthesis protein [Algibacter miyuki]MDN3667169.1 polysaccharide biosynthesis protein [Algibacter miyuki]